ncbi:MULTISPECIES: hypothetical protein [Paenibacillus]|nr:MULTISPECIES: hypothetical protein [Paenibacillus]
MFIIYNGFWIIPQKNQLDMSTTNSEGTLTKIAQPIIGAWKRCMP